VSAKCSVMINSVVSYLEELSKHTLIICIVLHYIGEGIFRIEVDQMLAWEMEGQSDNVWDLLMELIMENVPAGLWYSNVSCINVHLDFITSHLECGSIWAFGDVFVDVLCATVHISTEFNIDMTSKEHKQVWIIGNNIAIVICLSMADPGLAIVRASI
jgi:hypothetical protein